MVDKDMDLVVDGGRVSLERLKKDSVGELRGLGV